MGAMDMVTMARGVPMLSLATTEDLEAMVVMEAMAMDMVTMARGVPMLSLATTVAMEDLDTLVRWILLSLKVKQLANIISVQFCKNMKKKKKKKKKYQKKKKKKKKKKK